MTAELSLRSILRAEIDDILGPTIDAFRALEDAADATDDDAELGCRARTIIRDHASKRIDEALARHKPQLTVVS